MKVDISKKDVIWSYLGTFLNILMGMLTIPLLMFYLDDDILGLWYIFSGVGAVATLFDFGFEVTFSRNVTYCWSGAEKLKKENVVFTDCKEPNYVLLKRILTTCRIIYGLISGAALVLLITVGTIYVGFVGKELEGNTHFIAWIIYSVSIFLDLYFGYYASFLRGIGDVTDANKSMIYARLSQLALLVVMLEMGFGLIGVCLANLANGLLFRILAKHYTLRYNGIGEKLRQVTEKSSKQQIHDLFLTVWHNAWRDGVISASNYLCTQASVIIGSLYLSLSETGAYSLGVQIAGAVATFASTLYCTYQPELQSAYVMKDEARQKRLMSMIVVSFVYLFVVGTVFAIFVWLPILRWFKPSVVVSVPVLLGMCLYQFVLQFRNCYGSYFSCTNRILYLKAYVFSAALCIALSLVGMGVLPFGLWGLILAQIISQAIYNLWKWPILAHRELKLSAGEMFRVGNSALIQRFFKIR